MADENPERSCRNLTVRTSGDGFQNTFTLLNLIVLVVTLVTFYHQLTEMQRLYEPTQGQAKAALIAQRPFLVIAKDSVRKPYSIEHVSDGIKLSMYLGIENTGPSPATAVNVSIAAIPENNNKEPNPTLQFQKTFCPANHGTFNNGEFDNGEFYGDLLPKGVFENIKVWTKINNNDLPSFKGNFVNVIACIDYIWLPEYEGNISSSSGKGYGLHHQTSVIWSLINNDNGVFDISIADKLPSVAEGRFVWFSINERTAGKFAN